MIAGQIEVRAPIRSRWWRAEPRNDNAAITRSVDPSDTVAWTMTGEIQLGKISRREIYRLPSPMARHASTYSFLSRPGPCHARAAPDGVSG